MTPSEALLGFLDGPPSTANCSPGVCRSCSFPQHWVNSQRQTSCFCWPLPCPSSSFTDYPLFNLCFYFWAKSLEHVSLIWLLSPMVAVAPGEPVKVGDFCTPRQYETMSLGERRELSAVRIFFSCLFCGFLLQGSNGFLPVFCIILPWSGHREGSGESSLCFWLREDQASGFC